MILEFFNIKVNRQKVNAWNFVHRPNCGQTSQYYSRQPHIIYNNDPPLQDFQINSIHKNTREQEDTDNT